MDYRFDIPVNRFGTNSVKYDLIEDNGYPSGTLPMWVADMDFPAPPEVRKSLGELAAYGVFGYSYTDDSYYDAVTGWFASRHGFAPKSEWLLITPGVVYAVATAIRALTEPGDGVLIQRPVYYPFERLIKANGRRLVNNPLIYRNGVYSIDFDDFAQKLERDNVKMFILCSPHNPVGRVWSADELKRLGGLCASRGVIVVADEIHCDFIYPGNKFVPFGLLGDDMLHNSVICTSPSKTFNLAGLQLANIFIADKSLRDRFKAELSGAGYGGPNIFAMPACRTAYERCAPWLDALLDYLRGNLDLLRSSLAEKLPIVKLVEPEGTYLSWLDFTGLGLDDKAINDILKNKTKLWLDRGSMFGPEGAGFQRINIACPRALIRQAVDRLAESFI